MNGHTPTPAKKRAIPCVNFGRTSFGLQLRELTMHTATETWFAVALHFRLLKANWRENGKTYICDENSQLTPAYT